MLRPTLPAQDKSYLIAFLRSLTSERAAVLAREARSVFKDYEGEVAH